MQLPSCCHLVSSYLHIWSISALSGPAWPYLVASIASLSLLLTRPRPVSAVVGCGHIELISRLYVRGMQLVRIQ